MKKILFGGSLAVAVFALFLAMPAKAAAPNWKLSGSYVIDFQLGGGHYVHTMNVSSFNIFTGNFNGTGYYNPDTSYTWNINGNVDGDNITFHILYTGTNAGYAVDANGIIASDGTMSGTATGPGQDFTWASTSGKATMIDEDQCKKDGWKKFREHQFFNQGECVGFFGKNKDKCKKDGWIDFWVNKFKNQGDCVSYFHKDKKEKLIDTITVDSSKSTPTSSNVSLKNGKKYTIKVSGTWINRNDSNQAADAEYATLNKWTTWMDGYNQSDYTLGLGEFDLQINGGFVNWGAYNPAHKYSHKYTGTGGKVNFLIFDGDSTASSPVPNAGWYGDNSGSLTVKIYQLP